MNREDIIRMRRRRIMDREEIIRMARNEYGIYAFTAESLAEFATIIAAAEREKLAAWMIKRGYATGHGDTIGDLLNELDEQIWRNWRSAMKTGVETERQACAKVCEEIKGVKLQGYEFAAVIRARGQA
jgi:hypothetical protein